MNENPDAQIVPERAVLMEFMAYYGCGSGPMPQS